MKSWDRRCGPNGSTVESRPPNIGVQKIRAIICLPKAGALDASISQVRILEVATCEAAVREVCTEEDYVFEVSAI